MSTVGVSAAELGPLAWRKSRASNASGACVELASLPGGGAAVRDSRHRQGPALICTRAEITAFVRAAKSGRLDRTGR